MDNKGSLTEFSNRGNQGALISLVSPVYNEQDSLVELYERIKKVIPSHFRWELIFIDDGSKDKSREILKKLAHQDSRVKCVFFSRNYGHQIALTAGYDFADGDAVITLDSDLQHPPEFIPHMLGAWEDGNDIIFVVRKTTKQLGLIKRVTTKCFYAMLKKIANLDLVEGAADFRLLDKRVVYYLRQYKEKGRFLRGIISDMGFRREVLFYDEPERKYGEVKYNLGAMLRFGLTGIVSFSSFPLRISTVVGFVISLLSIIYAAWIVYLKLTQGVPSGVASILVGIFFIGGVQLISIGILGEYIMSIFKEVKGRPLYCISEIINDTKA